MRVPLVAAIILLAGCASSAPVEPVDDIVDEVVDPWNGATEMVLLSGSKAWHEPQGLGAYRMAAQLVAHPCAWQDDEVYFTNLQLGQTPGLLNETSHIEVVLTWDPMDYTRDALRVGYSPAGGNYRETTPFGNGETVTIPVLESHWIGNETTDDRGRSTAKTWDFWACADEDTGNVGVPPLFHGELDYEIKAFRS